MEATPFHCTVFAYFCADWDCLFDHLRYVPCKNIFKLGAFCAASEFCDRVLAGIDLYIQVFP